MRHSHEEPFEELVNPARLFLLGLLLLGSIQFFLGAAHRPTAQPSSQPHHLAPRQDLSWGKYPAAKRARIYRELARAQRRAENEFIAFFSKHPDPKYEVILTHLNDKYYAEIGKKYGITRQELEQIKQEGQLKRWLNDWEPQNPKPDSE